MKAKISVALILAAGVLAATLAVLHPPGRTAASEPRQPDTDLSSALAEPPQPQTLKPVAATRSAAPAETETKVLRAPADAPAAATNKLERLTRTRESFRALAAGDPTPALRAAKQITDETERETALLTLVTEWTHGDLRSPQERASAIAAYGLEAGLGMELSKTAELALLWANELTDSSGRTALLGATAIAMVGSDPAAALALGDQIAQADRRNFFDTVFAGWAGKDTEAALRWLDQVPDPADRDAALVAIRSVAPVGIGAALAMQDGYPTIKQVLPGTPSELSGQLHPGDRILALAQGDNSFLDARNLSLQDIVQMVRGAPGTLLQLQVLSADAPPNSLPRNVPIIRDQIKFKQ
jgi:PDZ domain-containing protein